MKIEVIAMIIGLLFYFFGGKSKTNKKRSAGRNKSGHGNNPPTLEEIIRQFSGQSEPKKVEVEPVTTPPDPVQVTPKSRPKRTQTQREPYRSSGKLTKIEDLSTLRTITLDDDIVEYEVDDEDVDFSLRQAVINDAILNAPYINKT